MAQQQSVLGAALKILLGRGSVAVITLVIWGYLARELPQTTMGLIALHTIFVTSSKVFLELGLPYAVLREGTPLVKAGRVREAVERIIGLSVWVRLCTSGTFSAMYALAGWLLTDLLSESFPGVDVRSAVLFGALHLFFKNAQLVLSAVFFAHDRFGTESTLDSASALMEKLVAVALYLSLGIDHFFLGMWLGQATVTGAAIGLAWPTLRHLRPSQLVLSEVRRWLVAYRPAYLRTVFRQGMRQADRLLIVALVAPEALAVQHVARQGSTFLQFVGRAFIDPLTVRLAESTDPKARAHHVRVASAFVTVIPFVVTLLAPFVMPLLGGEKYADSWPILALLCFSYVFYGLAEVQLSIVTMLGQGNEPVRMDAIAGLLGLLATYLGVVWFGDIGMAYGQVASYVVLYLGGLGIASRVWKRTQAAEEPGPVP